MTFKKVILMIVLTLYSFTTLGQQSGGYIVPTELQGIISESFLDSMRAGLALKVKAYRHIDYNSLGELIWYGSTGLKWLSNDTNKVKITNFSCTKNGWIKSESQFDILNKTNDYEIHTPCYNVFGNDFWTESIELNVVDSNEIIIKSPIEVTVEIYTAYTFYPIPIAQLSVEVIGIEQSFQFNLESGTTYIVVFMNNDKDIVNIKRIGG